MISLLCVVLALALLAAVFGLSRELRLRKALERLLRILLNHWRTNADQNQSENNDRLDPPADPGL